MENGGREIKSWKFKKVMEKSWNFSTAYRESCTRNSDNSISAVFLLWQTFSLCFIFQIVMLGKSKLTSNSQCSVWI